MSKKEFYYQCILTRGTPTGRNTLVTWVEEKFAVQGKRVFIKGDLAYPETDVWVVSNVGMKQTAEWVADRQKAHERWRRVTDV